MAQQNKSSGSNAPTQQAESPRQNYIRWANVYLSAVQKEAAGLFAADPDAVGSYVSSLLSDGYNVSFSFNEKTDSFTCTVIGKTCRTEDVGWGMTSHAGSWEMALARTLFKLYVLREDLSFEEMALAFENPLP